jgi:cation diffusion facilitator family transporter
MTKSERYTEAMLVTKVGIFANIILVLLKFAAGILGRSSAIIADAVHSLSDFVSDILVIAGIRLAEKPADETHKYGHGKFETMTAVFLSFILIFTGLGLFAAGAGRIASFIKGRALPEPGWIAVYAAFLSIVVKELLYQYTIKIGRKINSQSVIANAIHHRSDSLSSIGAMLGVGGAVILGENWRVLDPVASIIVSIFIIKISISILKKSMNELLEASLGEEEENEILQIAAAVPGVIDPHDLKTRSIGSYIGLDIHIMVDNSLNIKEAHDISSALEDKLQERFGASSIITVHVDPTGEGEHKEGVSKN